MLQMQETQLDRTKEEADAVARAGGLDDEMMCLAIEINLLPVCTPGYERRERERESQE